MNLATRKALYEVAVVGEPEMGGSHIQDELEARTLYEILKTDFPNKTVLFCWRKPTVTKGQIDPDIY